jgi:uncharacterized membrane protein YhaH (DUF805 family)
MGRQPRLRAIRSGAAVASAASSICEEGARHMPNPVIRGFANVARFSGRDSRAQFWPFAGAAFTLYMVVAWAVLIPMVFPAVAGSQSFAAFQAMARTFIVGTLSFFVVLVALLAAAVARRLHDGGHPAIWGVLPLPFAGYSGVMFFRLVTQFETGGMSTGLFLSVFMSNLLYMVGVVTLIVLLALRGAPGANRYGDPPL